LTEFANYLESFVLCTEPILICGDFNIHVDDSTDTHALALIDLLNSMALQQHVVTPTQIHGHTLDLMITRATDNIIPEVPISDCYLSDHVTVLCKLKLDKTKPTTQRLTYRKLKSIDFDAFKEDLSESVLIQQTPCHLNELVDVYSTTLSSLLDKHAPICTRSIRTRERALWYTKELGECRKQRRRAERKWRNTGLDSDLAAFKSQKNKTTYLMNKARREFYTDLVKKDNSSDQKKLFRVTKTLLNMRSETELPIHNDKKSLANDMGAYFVKKISDIRTELDHIHPIRQDQPPMPGPPEVHANFHQFEILSTEAVKKIILKSPTKSCALDPVPTSVLKDCLDELIQPLTTMINMSLQTGYFPTVWKDALVIPILKRNGLDTYFKNYRPISNLQFVSKVVERAVTDQLYNFINNNNLLPSLQSAYHPGYSTETALLKVKNDILMNMDNQQVTLLVLLDLSAAFDTVDHSILCNRLTTDFGITGTVLDWLQSYLSNRCQRVMIDGTLSDVFQLNHGLPQGSCLGPLLFLLYSSKLFKIISNHLPQAHSYADDTQLYLAFKPGDELDEKAALDAMEGCIADIKEWMLHDKLKLNAEKTEFLVIGTKRQLEKVNITQLQVAGSSVNTSTTAIKNLGSWFDSNLNMQDHIKKTCRSAFYNIYNIRRIRKYLTRDVTESIVNALVTSKLDYCNSLLYGIANIHLSKLQRVQNAAARLIVGASRKISCPFQSFIVNF